MWKGFYTEISTAKWLFKIGGFYDASVPDAAKSPDAYRPLESWSPPDTADGFILDSAFAAMLAALSPECVGAVGASMIPAIHRYTESCGGVIGNPAAENDFSDGFTEASAPGLVTLALPGGPGCIIAGNNDCEPELEQLGAKLSTLPSKYDKINALKSFISRKGYSDWLIMDDGCGPDATGIVKVHCHASTAEP